METLARQDIREGRPSDHAQLLQVDELARSQPERGGRLLDALHEGECLVAEAGGEVFGFVVLNYTFFGFGFIPLVVVGEGNRRAGIGLQLLAAAEARCASTKLFTSTNASNAAAHRLLARAGFQSSHRGLSPDKLTPMSGVHNRRSGRRWCAAAEPER